MIANTDQGVNRSKIYPAKVHALSDSTLRLIADKANQGWQIVDRLLVFIYVSFDREEPNTQENGEKAED